jgi:hypothetical protein
MPSKRTRYEVDEYVPIAHNPAPATNNATGGSQSITQRHTQYEMSDALRTSRVKTVLSVEHEAEPTTLTDEIIADDIVDDIVIADDTDLPGLIEVDYDSDDEETDANSGYDDDINRKLEAAGLGEIHAPETIQLSGRVRKTHTVSHTSSHSSVLFLLHV